MPYLIGTDEAGYGPNLGPLVIAASVWRVPDALATADLYDALSGVVTRTATHTADAETIAIADSKTLYKSGGGLQGLERGLYTALALLGQTPAGWRACWQTLAPEDGEQLATFPGGAHFDRPLPLELDQTVLTRLVHAARQRFQETGIELVALRAKAVFPARFNELLDELGNKATLLSLQTLQLVRQELERCAGQPVLVQCDKHGGRSKYRSLLQTLFPEWVVEVYEETQARSRYRWGPPAERVEIRFAVHGEQFLPAALASMAAKYLRELAMLAFNTFWQQHVPGLRPTAGYPVDALRFQADIADSQARLQIPGRRLWRNR